MSKLREMYIGGAFTGAADGKTFEDMDPSTGKLWATVPDASRADTKRAIDAAELCYATRFDRVVLFGDGPWDLTSAREAEIDFIGINEHPRGRDRLCDAGAEHVFPDFADVDAVLRVLRLAL